MRIRKARFSRSNWSKALPAYLGGKRNLAPTIANAIGQAGFGPDTHRRLIDPFAGGLSTSLFFKLCGYEVHSNDISFRSFVAAKALLENNRRTFTPHDLKCLMGFEVLQHGVVVTKYTPHNFPEPHALMMDRVIQFAHAQKDPELKYLTLLIAWKYVNLMCPLAQFKGKNVFNLPFHEGRFDQISDQYSVYLKRAALSPMKMLKEVIQQVNGGVTPTPYPQKAYQGDALEFILEQPESVVYLDPPYPNTTGYKDYHPVEEILQNKELTMQDDWFTGPDSWVFIDEIIQACEKHPLLCISLGNAKGKNQFSQLTDIIVQHRPNDQHMFLNLNYKHERQQNEDDKPGNEEWLCLSWRKP